jgi:ribA/ribD-fused uncharacterized protein
MEEPPYLTSPADLTADYEIDSEHPLLGFFNEFKCFSNFHKAKILWLGIEFPATEHAFMATKTLVDAQRQHIATIDKSPEVKKYGRWQVTLRPDWEAIKFGVMLEVNRAKYTSHHKLAGRLISTEHRLLVESNTWHDNIWGDCRCQNRGGKHPQCLQPGANWLGIVLMHIRHELGNPAPAAQAQLQ